MDRGDDLSPFRHYGVALTPENGPQSLTGGAALPTGVLSEGALTKSNMSISVSAD